MTRRLSAALAQLAEVYVNDAFGTAHRAHCSTEGVARLIPERGAGLLLEREVRVLTGLLNDPARPLVAALEGVKVSDKLGVIERFLEIADTILVGGAMCFPFLAAQGHHAGSSVCSEEDIELASRVLDEVPDARAELRLPVDLVTADEFAAEAKTQTIDGVDMPDGWMGLDIGPQTADGYAALIANAGTVFWSGPMGAFELEPFAAGITVVAEAVASAPGTTVAGGGDSAAALAHLGLADRVTHVSTGGGAAPELIEGRKLPGIEVLE
jgi:phosphoglycerate kinase